MSSAKKVIIGRLGAPYGIKGWMRLISFTEPMENILNYSDWVIGIEPDWQPLHLEGIKLQSKGFLIKLQDCQTPEDTRAYTNAMVAVERKQLPTLSDDAFYWADLEGLQVINTENIHLGVVHHILATGANDVLVVKSDKQERLIPYTKNVIFEVDMEKHRIVVEWDADF
jgi:16S rRNA processing protein RimM